MTKKKIQLNTRATREIDKYPMVAVYWLDICSDSSWQCQGGISDGRLWKSWLGWWAECDTPMQSLS